jgi:hypothetical protein
MNNRYQNIRTVLSDPNNVRSQKLYANSIYPDIPLSNNDSYVITVLGDRLDLLALDFYGDIGYWWIIASANSLPGDSLFPPPGMQLRLPANLQTILSNYKRVNIVR